MSTSINEKIYLNKLTIKIEELITNFNGLAGISIKDLNSGWHYGLNDDLIFPTASSIKIPILLKLIQESQNNNLDLSRIITITDDMKSRGSGIIHKMQGTINLSSAGDRSSIKLLFIIKTTIHVSKLVLQLY